MSVVIRVDTNKQDFATELELGEYESAEDFSNRVARAVRDAMELD